MRGCISVGRDRAGDQCDHHGMCVAGARDELRSRPLGCNLGCKLSATERNSEQLKRLQSAESQRVRLDRSGWEPGGRRFKSCLPDHTKVLEMSLFSAELPEAPERVTGTIF